MDNPKTAVKLNCSKYNPKEDIHLKCIVISGLLLGIIKNLKVGKVMTATVVSVNKSLQNRAYYAVSLYPQGDMSQKQNLVPPHGIA